VELRSVTAGFRILDLGWQQYFVEDVAIALGYRVPIAGSPIEGPSLAHEVLCRSTGFVGGGLDKFWLNKKGHSALLARSGSGHRLICADPTGKVEAFR
jgi:hypothetical protein